MTLYRGTVLDVPGDPFVNGTAALRSELDGGLLVRDGRIVARGGYADLRRQHSDEDVTDLRGGVLVPGFVDTHVHFPQVRVIGGLGMPLLEWLDRCALPEEERLVDRGYAEVVAGEFLNGLTSAGTTTALVFGSHFGAAMDGFFAAADQSGLRITAGLVLSDRVLPPSLQTTAARARAESRVLMRRWHGHERLRYAVTPRFSLSASEPLLEVCEELLAEPGTWFTTHINENTAEIDRVATYFPARAHYLDTYQHHNLIIDRSVLAHNVHATDQELEAMAAAGAWAAHCPTSNAALGSGLFPLRRHLAYGVGVALGSDVGAGTGFSLLKEGLQAYFAQQLLGPAGLPLNPVHLLYLATGAGARALGLTDEIGDLGVGRAFDAVWLRPVPRSTLEVGLAHASDATDGLAKIFALGTVADVAGVWVAGRRLGPPQDDSPSTYSRPQEAA